MWCAHTTHPISPILTSAYTIFRVPKTSFLPVSLKTLCLKIPKAGKIKTYTSGCPKNQNRCWYARGFPPEPLSKKYVLKFRSIRSMVIAPAKTGKDTSNKIDVIRRDHTNSLVCS
jgi:hypothetical protein